MRASILVATLSVGVIGLVPLSAAQTTTAPARINVTVPADATLTIDGQATQATSVHRQFVTPPLEHGHYYYYNLKASFVRNGKTITIEKKVRVRPGRRSVVALDIARTSYNNVTGFYTPATPSQVTSIRQCRTWMTTTISIIHKASIDRNCKKMTFGQ